LHDKERAAITLQRRPAARQNDGVVHSKELERLEKLRDGTFPGRLNVLERTSPPFSSPYLDNVNVLVRNGEHR